MKRVVRKQLKEDEFVSTMTKVINFIKIRTRLILFVSAGLVFLILFYLGVRFIQAQHLRKESELLSQLLSLKAELKTNPEKLADLGKLAGGGKFGRVAFVIEATYWVEKGEFERADEALAKFPEQPKDFLYFQAQDLLGQIQVFRKNYDQAIAIFERIEKEKPEKYGLDVILYHKAEALEARGNRGAALSVYKSLQEKFPQSYYGFDASERARRLESNVQPSL